MPSFDIEIELDLGPLRRLRSQLRRLTREIEQMHPETVRVEDLDSMLTMIAAYRGHEAARREVRFKASTASEQNEKVLAESCATPIVFADSSRRRVQVELAHFEPLGGDDARRPRRVLVWNAEDGVPPEIEALRELAGKRVLCSQWSEALRPFMPQEQHLALLAFVEEGRKGVECYLDGDCSKLNWQSGVPEPTVITWQVKAADGFSELTVTMRLRMDIAPEGVCLICWFGLDIDSSHDDPNTFRDYVNGKSWGEAGAKVVWGEPPNITGLARSQQATPVVIPPPGSGYGRREMVSELSFEIPAGSLGPRAIEGVMRRVGEAAMREGGRPVSVTLGGVKLLPGG